MNHLQKTLSGLVLALPLLASSAMAENRYSFSVVEGGFARFDQQSGQIDICLRDKTKVTCVLNDDARVQYEDKIKALEAKIAELEKAEKKSALSLPSKDDIDQSVDMMKYFFDRFQGMMKDEDKAISPQKPEAQHL